MTDGEQKRISGIRISTVYIITLAVAVAFSLLLIFVAIRTNTVYRQAEDDTDSYVRIQQDAYGMQRGSDQLTQEVRSYAVTGDIAYLRAYFEEAEITRQRDRALESIRSTATDSEALAHLEDAMAESVDLMEQEYHAMRLVLSASGEEADDLPVVLAEKQLAAEEEALSEAEKRTLAQELVFGEAYQQAKEMISENVTLCTERLMEIAQQQREASTALLLKMRTWQMALIAALLLIIIATIVLTTILINRPLKQYIRSVQDNKPMRAAGAYETRFLAESFNRVYEQTQQHREKLTYEALHDPLTGAFNRRAYDSMLAECDEANTALILVDVDYFKQINDVYGHPVGDEVLKRVAAVLSEQFRSEDHVCRIGGDEFAVLMVHVTSALSGLVQGKMARVAERLRQGEPEVTLSVGIAFGDREKPSGSMMKDADTALYTIKDRGRNGCAVYDGNTMSKTTGEE